MFLSFLTESKIKVAKRNFYFVPSQQYLSFVSATHKTFFAYLFFIRGILDLNESYPAAVNRMDYLLANFKAAGILEPKLIRAYFFGGIVVPVSRQDKEKAIVFLQEAGKLHPGQWQFPFWTGLNYLELGNYNLGAEYYLKAAQLPGSPSYLKTNLAFFYYKSGEFNQGIAYLQALMLSLEDQRLIKIISRKIEWLRSLAFLEERVERYFKIYGSWPEDLKELKEKKLIQEIPGDSFGRGFYLEKNKDGPKPRVKSRV